MAIYTIYRVCIWLLGAVIIIPLGYAYVGLTVALRHRFGPQAR